MRADRINLCCARSDLEKSMKRILGFSVVFLTLSVSAAYAAAPGTLSEAFADCCALCANLCFCC